MNDSLNILTNSSLELFLVGEIQEDPKQHAKGLMRAQIRFIAVDSRVSKGQPQL